MRIRSLAIMAALALCASNVFAGTVVVTPTVVARYNEAFEPLSFSSPGDGPITDGPGIYQIDLTMESTPMVGERGFGSLTFNVAMAPGMDVGLEYAPDASTVDSNGTNPGGTQPKWATNTDAGTGGDYQGILLAASGPLSATCGGANCPDPRSTLGDPDPEFFGSLFVRVLNTGPLGFTGYEFSMRDATTLLFLPPQAGQIAPLQFMFGPPPDEIDPEIQAQVVNIDLDVEPNSIENLQLTATDNLSLPENLVWSALSYAGPGMNAPGSDQPDMDADGVFNWDPAGWREGAHVFSATVTDEAGNFVSDVALTVNLIVPEPASFAMLGLAMVGLVGVIRRR